MELNKLEKSFQPLIEEFFLRATDQYEWRHYELKVAINKFERVEKIKFINLWENKLIYKKKSTRASWQYNLRKDETSIFFDIDDLKSILKFEQNK